MGGEPLYHQLLLGSHGDHHGIIAGEMVDVQKAEGGAHGPCGEAAVRRFAVDR